MGAARVSPILAAKLVARGRKKGPAESGGIGGWNGGASRHQTQMRKIGSVIPNEKVAERTRRSI